MTLTKLSLSLRFFLFVCWLLHVKENFKIKLIRSVLYEIMPFAATWMQLEIIILSEVSQKKINTI